MELQYNDTLTFEQAKEIAIHAVLDVEYWISQSVGYVSVLYPLLDFIGHDREAWENDYMFVSAVEEFAMLLDLVAKEEARRLAVAHVRT